MADDIAKKRLGRGLAALIGEMDQPVAGPGKAKAKSPSAAGELSITDRSVPVEHIRQNPNNPRRSFSINQLDDLAKSIVEHGIVQPILVRPVKGQDLGGAKYEIIAGERRWRAAQMANLHAVPIIIRDVEDKQALELAIIENVQRADLNPVEEASGYQQLIDEYDYSQSDLGAVIGKSRSHVANTLRLLKLPVEVQSMVTDGSISAGHARALVTSHNPKQLADRILKQGLSVRQVEMVVQKQNQQPASDVKKPQKSKSLNFKDPDIKALEVQIEETLGLKVAIHNQSNNSGEFRINYKSLDQLDEICRRLSKNN